MPLAGYEPEFLALNNDHAEELSWLDRSGLDALLAAAFHARRIGALDAALIAFDETARYASPNFLFFCKHCPPFVYVDRVVVAPEARCEGWGSASGSTRICFAPPMQATDTNARRLRSEQRPSPNPASDAFSCSAWDLRKSVERLSMAMARR